MRPASSNPMREAWLKSRAANGVAARKALVTLRQQQQPVAPRSPLRPLTKDLKPVAPMTRPQATQSRKMQQILNGTRSFPKQQLQQQQQREEPQPQQQHEEQHPQQQHEEQQPQLEQHAPEVCARCQRPHKTDKCRARSTIEHDVCHRCGRRGHWESRCSHETVENDGGVYVLECSQTGKRYVGTSTSVRRRLMQHRGELPGGARFTTKQMTRMRRVAPLPLPVPACDAPLNRLSGNPWSEETRQTISQMRLHGADAVRGASFCKAQHTGKDYARIGMMMLKEERKNGRHVRKALKEWAQMRI